MKNEIKPARTRAPYGFAKWEPPSKFERQSPPEHRNIPFADEYIHMDSFDKGVFIALIFGAIVVAGVTIWEWLI